MSLQATVILKQRLICMTNSRFGYQYCCITFAYRILRSINSDRTRKRILIVKNIYRSNAGTMGCPLWIFVRQLTAPYQHHAVLCSTLNDDWIEGILPEGSYLPCVSMAGRALLSGYPRILSLWCRAQYRITRVYAFSTFVCIWKNKPHWTTCLSNQHSSL